MAQTKQTRYRIVGGQCGTVEGTYPSAIEAIYAGLARIQEPINLLRAMCGHDAQGREYVWRNRAEMNSDDNYKLALVIVERIN